MRRAIVLLLTACGGEAPPVVEPPSGRPVVAEPTPPGVALERRVFTPRGPAGPGSPTPVWIEPARVAGMVTNDPCCGLWYDGNAYVDAIATCGPASGEDCADELWTVRPGLADDRVCGERRRCVPMPRARVVSVDGSRAAATDLEDEPFPIADARDAPYSPVQVTRMGAFLRVGDERVAIDHGARYTIRIAGGRIAGVTRDP